METQLVAEQFETLEQQHSADLLGMWVFLVTEIMFFGVLFAAYAVYRYLYPEAFEVGGHHLNTLMGGMNTGVLLTSSFTMAIAVHAAKTGKRRFLTFLLVATVLMGCAFLVIKGFEWRTDYLEGLVPGKSYTFNGAHASQVELFFTLYFIMTGLHGLHVIIGIVLLGLLAYWAWRGKLNQFNFMIVEISGLYWHFVDLVWIFLFPLFYLIGNKT